jgi:hypothetical protein
MSRNNTKQNKQSVTKNTCKSVLRLSAVATLIGIPAAAMADTGSLSLNSYSYGAGGEAAGEFAATDSAGVPAGYASTTSTSSTFETFCVQNLVFINTGTPYSSSEAQTTGNSTVQGGLALSEGVAYLYYQFATGNLSGYDYANNQSNNTRITDAGELQTAIWYFMGESSGIPSGWPSTSGNQFITLAENFLGNGNATLGATDAGLANGSGGTNYNVSILQLSGSGGVVQNQLILGGNNPGTGNNQSVPDGGLTLAMLGLGLAGLFYVNFQRTKSVARQN